MNEEEKNIFDANLDYIRYEDEIKAKERAQRQELASLNAQQENSP